VNEYEHCQQHQLGELRHTRDRLKLNLISSNGTPSASFVSVKQSHAEQLDVKESEFTENIMQDQSYRIESSPMNDDNVLPKVPQKDESQVSSSSTRILQCDSQETVESVEKCSVLARD
jgi:hypothetical protein